MRLGERKGMLGRVRQLEAVFEQVCSVLLILEAPGEVLLPEDVHAAHFSIRFGMEFCQRCFELDDRCFAARDFCAELCWRLHW